MATPSTKSDLAKRAFRFVLIFGVVNFFADFAYEGARSLNGELLASLGATSTIVGFTAGGGELIGYALRSLTGFISDKSGAYWTVVIIGFVVNMAAVPALALAGNWPLAAVLIVMERTGRAIRKPAAAAMLSRAGDTIGHGWVFGVNDAMDQAGATLGPLVMAAVIALHGGYSHAYGLLAIPAVCCVATVLVARRFFPRPHDLGAAVELEAKGFTSQYWSYVIAGLLIAVGFADFALIGYHLEARHVLSTEVIPVFYAVAMATAAIGSLVLGWSFDRRPRVTVITALLISSFFAPLAFSTSGAAVLAGTVLWGLGMSVQETAFKPLISRAVRPERRATGLGLFDTGFGFAWFAGSALMGWLYGVSLTGLVVFSIVAQLLAAPILFAGIGKRTT